MIIVHTTICQEFIKRVIDGPKGRKVFVTLEAGGYSFRRKRITTLGISFKDLKSSSTRYFSIQYILSYDGVFKTPSYVGGGGGGSSYFLFVKTIEKVIRLCTVLIFFL